jgi:plasmid maintenance system antidote protein VapI
MKSQIKSNTPTLQDIKKQQGLTNAAIAKSLKCSVSKVSTLLQGRHIKAISDAEIAQLATALSVTFERCWMAMCESYNQWNGTLEMEHQRPSELRSEVFQKMGIEGAEPRPMAMVDSCLVVLEERRLR